MSRSGRSESTYLSLNSLRASHRQSGSTVSRISRMPRLFSSTYDASTMRRSSRSTFRAPGRESGIKKRVSLRDDVDDATEKGEGGKAEEEEGPYRSPRG